MAVQVPKISADALPFYSIYGDTVCPGELKYFRHNNDTLAGLCLTAGMRL